MRARWVGTGSNNGSSDGHEARAAPAPRRTRATVPERDERARTAALWPAGQRAAPSSCLACRQTRKMESNIQESRREGFLKSSAPYLHQRALDRRHQIRITLKGRELWEL